MFSEFGAGARDTPPQPPTSIEPAAIAALRRAAKAALAARAAYLAGEPGMAACCRMRDAAEAWRAAATPEAVLAALGAAAALDDDHAPAPLAPRPAAPVTPRAARPTFRARPADARVEGWIVVADDGTLHLDLGATPWRSHDAAFARADGRALAWEGRGAARSEPVPC